MYLDASTGTITNNIISHNTALNGPAVSYSGGNNHDFKYNTIMGNITTGAGPTYTVYLDSHPLFNYNNIFVNNATYELWNDNPQGAAPVNAENNWWGTAIESEVQEKIYDWFDDATKGVVDYTPWETAIRIDAPISPPTGLTATEGTGSVTLDWRLQILNQIYQAIRPTGIWILGMPTPMWWM